MSAKFEIIQRFITNNRPGRPLTAKGIVIHNTENMGDNDTNTAQWFNRSEAKSSCHAIVDADSITQIIPWDEIAWHAGPTANRMYWGIEFCTTNDPEKFNEIWKRAVWLTAYMFTQTGLTPIYKVNPATVRSHADVSNEWKETDHMDPISYFAKFGVNMDMFRDAVARCISKSEIQDLIQEGLILMMLKKGDANQCVVTLQTQLKKLGYDITIDGSFGGQTEAAVKDFQSMMLLDADGVVGELTDKKLSECVIALKREVANETNSTLEITPPVPKVQEVPNWKKDGAKFLYEFGLMHEEHNPIEQVDIGTLGVTLKKFFELVK